MWAAVVVTLVSLLASVSRSTSDFLLPLLQQQAELVELVYTGGQPEGQRAGEDLDTGSAPPV